MRATGLVLVALAAAGALGHALGAAAAPPTGPGAAPTGFDHRLHDRDLVVSGAQSLPCTRCHAARPGGLIGRPDHAACFGACHGPAPRRPGAAAAASDRAGPRLAICTACHAAAQLTAPGPRGVTVNYPPYTLDPDFAITVGHRRHRELGCAQCHSAARPAPHQRCAGCHDGSGAAGHGPAMTACTGCHAPAAGAALPPSIIHAEINVAGAFSHARHAQRSAAGGRCTTCHAALRDTDDNILPAPSAASCATAHCHDGGAAFSITAACTRCHLDPARAISRARRAAPGPRRDPAVDPGVELGFKVERPSARYSHAAHAQVQLACAACHPLSPGGEVAVVGHAPCATCHAEDFGRRKPTICGACHNGTEPWRALVADRGPAERTEFGAALDHDKHPAACTRCHALTTPTRQLRPPRGHRACSGPACHAATGGPAPRLDACEACHRRGRADQREATRLAAAWSVRATFDHAAHSQAVGGAPACTACHVDLHGSDLAALATPPKASCAPCHDGVAAFKLTGTTCTRCHHNPAQGVRPTRATPPEP
jgi:hypothetical protein